MGERKIVIFLILFFLCLASVIAQTQIKGKVIDSQDKEPLVRAIVKLIQVSDNKILAFAQTNNQGEFSIKKGDNVGDCVLEFSYLGYTTSL